MAFKGTIRPNEGDPWTRADGSVQSNGSKAFKGGSDMKKGIKIFLIVCACIVGLGLIGGTAAFLMVGNAANAEEYTMGSDTIKSIKAVVEKRNVTSMSTEISDGVRTESVHYQSDSVQEDLVEYIQYLRDEAGFQLTQDMDLTQIPSTVQLGKESEDPGEILILTIDYDPFGYTLTLKKGKGSLTFYD